MGGAYSAHWRGENAAFQQENMKGSDYLEDRGIDVSKLKWIFKVKGVRVWSNLIWFMIGTSVNIAMNK
jgi:hypothetical protein